MQEKLSTAMTFSMLHLWAQITGKNSNFLFCHTFERAGSTEAVSACIWNQFEHPPKPPFFPFLIGSFSSLKITFAYFWLCYQIGWHEMQVKSDYFKGFFFNVFSHLKKTWQDHSIWIWAELKGYLVQLHRAWVMCSQCCIWLREE